MITLLGNAKKANYKGTRQRSFYTFFNMQKLF